MKQKKWYWFAAIAVIVVGYFWYRSAHSQTAQVQYTTATAQKGTLTTSVSGSGNVIVDQSVNIDPTITGTVIDLAVNVGDKVRKGQTLFSIVNDQLGVQADQARASYEQSKSSLESAQANLKQAKATYNADKKNNASDSQKTADKEKINAAEQAVTAAQQALNASAANSSYQNQTAGKRQVVAPMVGTVNAINIKNGDDLSKLSSGSSRTVPMIIGDLTTMKAQVQINEVDVPNVQIGQKVMMTFSALPGLSASGKVEKIDSLGTVTQGVVTYNATVDLDSLDARVKPGMSVSASIITGVKQDVIIVPNSAVKTKGTSNYVEVLKNGQSTPQQISVEIGATNNTETEIVSGINVGDNVVTRTVNPNATTTGTTNNQGGNARIPGLGGGRGFGG